MISQHELAHTLALGRAVCRLATDPQVVEYLTDAAAHAAALASLQERTLEGGETVAPGDHTVEWTPETATAPGSFAIVPRVKRTAAPSETVICRPAKGGPQTSDKRRK